MNKEYKTVCPLSCSDNCELILTIDNGEITKLAGSKNHPLTKGFICNKAERIIDQIASIDRIHFPLQKVGDSFKKITWEEAYDLICTNIKSSIKEHGIESILHIYNSESMHLLDSMSKRFFNTLGSVTEICGNIYSGNGRKAQELDFGGSEMHSFDDLENSKTIILWGKDPATNTIHINPYLLNAKKKGTEIISINPIKEQSAGFCDEHISIRPGTDGFLALGMMNAIFSNGWMDLDYIRKYVKGFEELVHLVKEYPVERVAKLTDIKPRTIEKLAKKYARNTPSSIILGHGVERYANGGQTIRAIDALAAITGNIGISGGGVNYSTSNKDILEKNIDGREFVTEEKRYIPWSSLGKEILNKDKNQVKMIFINRTDPLNIAPNTEEVMNAFNQVSFKVCMDTVLTDTALKCDLILPCTNMFEEENIVVSNNNYYINFVNKIMNPKGNIKTDIELFTVLSEKMGTINQFKVKTSHEWLAEALIPLKLDLDSFKEGAIKNPMISSIAWSDKKFKTPSGKIEIYSEKAKAEGINPLCEIGASKENLQTDLRKEYPYHFITDEILESLDGQFRKPQDDENIILVSDCLVHPELAEEHYLKDGDLVIVESLRGQVKARVKISDRIREDIVRMHQGRWIKEGGGVNFLTPSYESDLKTGVASNDCLCTLRKVTP